MQHIQTALQNLNLPTPNGSDSALTIFKPATTAIVGCAPLESLHGEVAIAEITGQVPIWYESPENRLAAKKELLELLTAAYKLDYFDEKSVHCQGAIDVFRRAEQKGWSLQEFFDRLDAMTEQCAFPTWTPADFFRAPREVLHSYQWACAQNDWSALEAYKIPDVEKPLWRRFDGQKLENRYEGWVCVNRCGKSLVNASQPVPRLLPPPPECDEAAKVLAVEIKRRIDAELENDVLQKRCEVYEKRLRDMAEYVERLEAEIKNINSIPEHETFLDF